MQERKRVAIVGSGCSGIGALWALKSTDHEVHLYEAADRLGGHTNTVTFEQNGKMTNVDTGFIVMNSATYPNFIAFLKEVGVPTVPTEMTFGVSRDQGLFEWAGTSLGGLFAQKSNIFRGRVWLMLFDIIRFNQFALDLLWEISETDEDPSVAHGTSSTATKTQHQESIGAYLVREGYSAAFRDDYLIPMTAAVWSTSPDKCSLDFPAITLVRFMWNHHLLSTISARPTWMTIKNGSQQYIDAVMADFPSEQVHLSTSIQSLTVHPNGQLELHDQNHNTTIYDHVILATHGDQAMSILRDEATDTERAILSAFKTSANTAVLHSDLSLMPLRATAWSAWNYLTTSTPTAITSVCLTYWMNLLQHIPTNVYGPILVTLNPIHRPRPETIQGEWSYNHPLYTAEAIRAQSLLPTIQNQRGISYAGAWTKYGFHEDGFSSGVQAAMEHLGATIPFAFVDSTFSRGRRPVLGWVDLAVRAWVVVVQVLVVVFGGFWGLFGTNREKVKSA